MISALLNKKITIQEGIPSTNDVGSPILNWHSYMTTWAGVYTPYRNVQFGDGEQLVYTTEFTIRHNDKTKEITNKFRVYYDGDYYHINQISEIGNKEGYKLITTMWEDD